MLSIAGLDASIQPYDPENDVWNNRLHMHWCLRDVVVWLRHATTNPDPATLQGLHERLQTACAESGHALESNGELYANAGIALSLTLMSLSLPENLDPEREAGFRSMASLVQIEAKWAELKKRSSK